MKLSEKQKKNIKCEKEYDQIIIIVITIISLYFSFISIECVYDSHAHKENSAQNKFRKTKTVGKISVGFIIFVYCKTKSINKFY